MSNLQDQRLYLRFSGRIIDSLGIQMYQSPTAAIAELIANAWDADATRVNVKLPDNVGEGAEIVVRDDGAGMTFEECQDKYLNVGRNRRLERGGSYTPGNRPCLGRKGIGKFAGFGIAEVVEIGTTSAKTGERTHFRLDLGQLRSETGPYLSNEPQEIKVLLRERATTGRDSGTTVTLKSLKLSRRPNPDVFASSMARRFVLAQRASNFGVFINESPLPESIEPFQVEFEFPRDYRPDELPPGLNVGADGWGFERLSDSNDISWQIKFSEDTIELEEFRGVGVYCGVKLAQVPFFFQLSGGLAGQHGQQYMTGRVKADYLDQSAADVIATERQRITWEHPEAQALLNWGQERIKSLLKLWQERRAEARVQALEAKVSVFGNRLSRLPPTERRTVRKALTKLASIPSINSIQFGDLGKAILTAWEGGKLQGLIEDISHMEDMTEGVLISLLAEEQILSALHIAETVKSKVNIVRGLRKRIEKRELENSIRDYIAQHPWLISPDWETFQIEKSLKGFLQEAQIAAEIDEADEKWRGRMDLVLRAGSQLIVLEFMRPGLTADRDHFNRFQTYIDTLVTKIVRANTGLGIDRITGLLVADKLDRNSANMILIERLRQANMLCEEWSGLLAKAEKAWEEFLDAVVDRAPDDERLTSLVHANADG